ncbi:MAG: hypothetical protein LBV23_01425 [Deltaproteobacteria bacterium]|nr:hypothetical protein [Deltaproteobacteria bacterium]
MRDKLSSTAGAIRDIADKYFPTGEESKFTNSTDPIYVAQGARAIELRDAT